ncbi:MAG: hypothetical protein AB7T31_17785 [Gemmatimonadales bacterium]
MQDFDLKALYAALDEKRRSLAMTWADVARAVGTRHADRPDTKVSAGTITGMLRRRSVEADGVLQMLRWLDRTPESFCGQDHGEPLSASAPAVLPGRTLRFDAAAIHAALDAKRAALGASWATVAREIGGYSPQNLTRLAQGGRVAFPGIMRVVRWTEVPSTRFMRATSR